MRFLDTMYPCSKDKSMGFLYPHNLAQQTSLSSITFSRFVRDQDNSLMIYQIGQVL
ncbi:hypothetical protein KFK09_010234 [Dendrobium nobile]|uniref:Uncharacterized protein n=1 Tax=Dendrobium nobile TaxID=94219 RepID=A0A8T3BNB3_DENNO|nr:hypothetical protein KFK09_010234 [Dendrobium nobile]